MGACAGGCGELRDEAGVVADVVVGRTGALGGAGAAV